MTVTSVEWLRVIEEQYLSSFITSGGAAVKFIVVPDDETLGVITGELDSMAERYALIRTKLDSADVRLHMIHDIFFAIARQIDWIATAQRFMEGLVARQGYVWPTPGEAVSIHQIAEANKVDLTIMRRDVRQWLTSSIMRDNGMAQDFRIAMTRLCLERLGPDDSPGSIVTPVLEWLTGELRTIGSLKSASIYTKITRHNARAMLRSLCKWLRNLGHQGLLATIDLRRVTRPVPSGTEGVRYTPAAVLDSYEVLRQLIDESDHFDGFFLTVLCDSDFIGLDQKRSIESYTALKMRIWDDVKARERDNPLAPLVAIQGVAIQ